MLKKDLLKKKIDGICYHCTSKAEFGFTLCNRHRVLSNEAGVRARQNKKKLGRCFDCGAVAIKDKTRCQIHIDIHNEDYRRMRDEERCPSCGAINCKGLCKSCKDKTKERRKKILELGNCPSHSSIAALSGKTICTKCVWLVFESALKTKYNITIETYGRMEYEQDRKCKICKEIPIDGLVLDHCHKTEKIRSLLCGPCNKMLGFSKENVERLNAGAEYLVINV